MLRPLLVFPALASLVALVAFAAPACTSSSSSGSPGTATPSDYCSAVSSYVSQCHVTDPCTSQVVQQCSSLAGIYSPSALGALTSCFQSAGCGDGGTSAVTACTKAALANATPSAAQSKLASDYCASCPGGQTTAACESSFFAPAAGDGGTAGPGNAILAFNDTIASKVDTQCTPSLGADAGTLGCNFTFGLCEAVTLVGAVGFSTSTCSPAALDAGVSVPDGG